MEGITLIKLCIIKAFAGQLCNCPDVEHGPLATRGGLNRPSKNVYDSPRPFGMFSACEFVCYSVSAAVIDDLHETSH